VTSDSEENPQNEDKILPDKENRYNSTPNSCRLRSNSQGLPKIKVKKFNGPRKKSIFAHANCERQNDGGPTRLNYSRKEINNYGYARSDSHDESSSPEVKHTKFFTTNSSGSKSINDDSRIIADSSIVNRSSQNIQLDQSQTENINRGTQSLHHYTAKRPKYLEIPKSRH
jgi:hypothetical protein